MNWKPETVVSFFKIKFYGARHTGYKIREMQVQKAT